MCVLVNAAHLMEQMDEVAAMVGACDAAAKLVALVKSDSDAVPVPLREVCEFHAPHP
jgi:hypothetical protein